MCAIPASEVSTLLDVKQVGELLGCSPRHVHRLVNDGHMPQPVRLGALVRWRLHTGDPETGLEDWVTDGCRSLSGNGKGGQR